MVTIIGLFLIGTGGIGAIVVVCKLVESILQGWDK